MARTRGDEEVTDLYAAARQALECLECLEAPASGSIDHYELQRRTGALRAALAASERQFLPDWANYRQGVEDGRSERTAIEQ